MEGLPFPIQADQLQATRGTDISGARGVREAKGIGLGISMLGGEI
jgi:hypothetical protein